MDAEILALASAADGLAVTVGRTPIGTYRVVFRDTDADERSVFGCLPIAIARSGTRAV